MRNEKVNTYVFLVALLPHCLIASLPRLLRTDNMK